MSYSQLVLSEKPYGYWDCSSIVSGALDDLTTFSNNATLTNAYPNKKPIIYGPESSVMLLENSLISIDNIYKVFFKGSEDKPFSIELFFSIINSSTTPHQILKIGSFIECYVISDRIYIKSNNQVSSIKVKNWETSNYLCLRYGSGSVSITLNNLNTAAINLGTEFSFVDETPPDFIFGPSAGYDSPLYINSIAFYSFSLIDSEMLIRQSWAMYDSKSERIAIANNADIINPSVDELIPNFSYSIDTKDRFLQGYSQNIIFKDNYITLPSEPPVQIVSLDNNPQFNIDLNGISLSGDSYVDLSNAYKYFSGDYNVIRQQVTFDGLSTKQSILHIGPMLDRSSMHLYKSTSNTIVLESISSSGTATTISESGSLGSDFTQPFDISLAFLDGFVTLSVNDISEDPESSAYPAPGFDFYLGNSFSLNTPLTSKIKNFSIDSYEDGDEIIFTNTGDYTLKFNNSLSVSQRGLWNYQIEIPENSITSLINYNYASKNCYLYVNDSFIEKTTLIPNISYDSKNILNIEVELRTDDSFNYPSVFSGVSILTYDSVNIPSSNGIYRIEPIEKSQSENYVSTDPFLIRYTRATPLDRPLSLGITFNSIVPTAGDYLDDLEAESWTPTQSQVTSGANLVINNTSSNQDIAMLEFLIKLNRTPSTGEQFVIFDVDGSTIDLKYSDTGIVLSSGYTLYIDGQEASAGQDLEEFEFYHFLVRFTTPVSSVIKLGVNSERTVGLDGSMGFFAAHSSVPSNFESYLSLRYNSIIGRPSISKTDPDSIQITDFSGSPQEYEYSQDGKYFAMKQLPKVKIVQNKWQTIK
jgi:hypothetical protein